MPTGVEEAGIGLAVVGLTFQVFAGCVKGFQLLSTAHNLGRECELLICWLKLEEYRLILWAKKSGLIDDNLDPRFDEEIVKATLGELRSLLENTEKLKKRYNLDVRDDHTSVATVPLVEFSSETLRFLNDATIQNEQEKILKRAKFEQRKTVFPKRLWFAAVDRDGFERLISQISTIIQGLFNLLALNAQEDTQKSLHLMQLSLFSIVEKLQDVNVLTSQVHAAVIPDETLSTVAALRKLHIELSNPSGTNEAREAPVASQRLLTNIANQAGRIGGTTALYEGVPVYLEVKHYSNTDADNANATRMLNRARDLSLMLSIPKASSFHGLRCLGYFNNPASSEYSFVFERPLHSQTSVFPRSLLSLLKSSYLPSVTRRVKLALQIATTLIHLHASGWLHKGLRSENVLFFPTTNDDARNLDKPVIMGYEYARNDSRPELSEKPSGDPAHDIYRHPRAQGTLSDRYRKTFDVYSLGIMFVEIALWRSFDDILVKMLKFDMKDVTPVNMEQIRQRMIAESGADRFPDNLRFRIGDEFAEATLSCLGLVFEDDEMTRQDFIITFYERVVRHLSNCRI